MRLPSSEIRGERKEKREKEIGIEIFWLLTRVGFLSGLVMFINSKKFLWRVLGGVLVLIFLDMIVR